MSGESHYKILKECSNLKIELEKLKKDKALLQIELQSTQEELNMVQEEHCRTEIFLRDHIKDLVIALGRQGTQQQH